MTRKEYNGWANYETWLVNLWLDNDQSTQEQVIEICMEERGLYQAAEALKEFVESFPEVEEATSKASFVCDLINASLSEVDWCEIVATVRHDNEYKEEGVEDEN